VYQNITCVGTFINTSQYETNKNLPRGFLLGGIGFIVVGDGRGLSSTNKIIIIIIMLNSANTGMLVFIRTEDLLCHLWEN